MTIREQIKQQRKEVMKNGTRAEKWAYFFEYYTLHLIGVIALIAITACIIVGKAKKPQIVLNGIVLNVFDYENKDPVGDFAKAYIDYEGLKPSKYELALNSSLTFRVGKDESSQYNDYETSQIILTQIGAGEIDFIISPQSAVIEYANNDVFLNLKDVLSEEDYERYEPYFLYVDRTVIKAKDELVNEGGNPDKIPTPDPTKPEEMEDPIPVLIDVSGCSKLDSIYNYTSETLVFGVTVKAPHQNKISSFLKFLFKE